MTGFGITTIPIGVYFDKEARRLQKCIIRHFGKTDFHRWSMLHRQEGITSECEMRSGKLRIGIAKGDLSKNGGLDFGGR